MIPHKARLLEKSALMSVQGEHGRFRSFLLASLKNFLANDWDRHHTVKRGGEFTLISWDDQSGEDRYRREPSHDSTPEKIFEQNWALTVIAAVMEQLRQEYAGRQGTALRGHSALSGRRRRSGPN